MKPDDRTRIQHILEAAEDAIGFCHGMMESDFREDNRTHRAVIQCIEVIGEASRHLSPEAQAEIPNVPWPAVRSMRNHLAHMYYDINLGVVWTTVQDDRPALIDALKAWKGPPPPPTTA